MALSKKLRFEVFKRDLFACQYCGRRPPEVVLECDHVKPRREGGSDDMDNLTTSCVDCNRGKAGNGLEKIRPAVDELARLAAIQEMAERSALLLQEQHAAKACADAVQASCNQVWTWWYSETNDVDAFQEASVRMFLKRGLSTSEMRDAIDATMLKWGQARMSPAGAWRYFCGSCWGKIRDREGTE